MGKSQQCHQHHAPHLRQSPLRNDSGDISTLKVPQTMVPCKLDLGSSCGRSWACFAHTQVWWDVRKCRLGSSVHFGAATVSGLGALNASGVPNCCDNQKVSHKFSKHLGGGGGKQPWAHCTAALSQGRPWRNVDQAVVWSVGGLTRSKRGQAVGTAVTQDRDREGRTGSSFLLLIRMANRAASCCAGFSCLCRCWSSPLLPGGLVSSLFCGWHCRMLVAALASTHQGHS